MDSTVIDPEKAHGKEIRWVHWSFAKLYIRFSSTCTQKSKLASRMTLHRQQISRRLIQMSTPSSAAVQKPVSVWTSKNVKSSQMTQQPSLTRQLWATSWRSLSRTWHSICICSQGPSQDAALQHKIEQLEKALQRLPLLHSLKILWCC